MLKTLTISDFLPLIGSSFQLQEQPEAAMLLELLEAVKLGDRPAWATNFPESFSLLFKGPSDRILPQRIYRLLHSQLGELGILLAPVARQADSIHYEAIFN